MPMRGSIVMSYTDSDQTLTAGWMGGRKSLFTAAIWGLNSQESRAAQHSPSDHTHCWQSRKDTVYSDSPAEDGSQTHIQSNRPHPQMCVYVCVVHELYLVEPKVIRLKKTLEFWEQLVVVEAVDGLHITRAVIQVACHLM